MTLGDVLFHEDKSGHHQFEPATNFSVLSTIAINREFWVFHQLQKVEDGGSDRFWLLPILLA